MRVEARKRLAGALNEIHVMAEATQRPQKLERVRKHATQRVVDHLPSKDYPCYRNPSLSIKTENCMLCLVASTTESST